MKIFISTSNTQTTSSTSLGIVHPSFYYILYGDALARGPIRSKTAALDTSADLLNIAGLDPARLVILTGADLIKKYPNQCKAASEELQEPEE